MQIIDYLTALKHFGKVLNKVNEDCTPLMITRKKGKPVVLMPLREYNAFEETAHLLRSPANAMRLIKSIGSLRGRNPLNPPSPPAPPL